MKRLLLTLLLSLPLFAGTLQLSNGSVLAHTEMMMDSEINPKNNNLKAKINIEGEDITTLSGQLWVEMEGFISDKKDRDEHMYESLETKKFNIAKYTIKSVTPTNEKDIYTIDGTLNLHSTDKQISAKAKISFVNNKLTIDAKTMIVMPDFGIEMPCMVFMCVRDQVDLVIMASFN